MEQKSRVEEENGRVERQRRLCLQREGRRKRKTFEEDEKRMTSMTEKQLKKGQGRTKKKTFINKNQAVR